MLKSKMKANELPAVYQLRIISDLIATSGQPSVSQLSEIAAAGFTTIINLALHDDPRYSLPNERASVLALGLKYVHIPVPFSSPASEHLLEFFEAMENCKHERTWIHCAANIRVSAFLGLYHVQKEGWPVDQAFYVMNELWQPDNVWSAFIAASLKR